MAQPLERQGKRTRFASKALGPWGLYLLAQGSRSAVLAPVVGVSSCLRLTCGEVRCRDQFRSNPDITA